MRKLVKRKRNIEITVNKAISSFPLGSHRSLVLGGGGEFQTVREWQPGDKRPSVPATSRLVKPMFKNFEEPKAITVWLLVDNSPSMEFGAVHKKIDIACALCLMFGFSVDNVADRLSAATFGSGKNFFIEPGSGCSVASTIIDLLLSGKEEERNDSITESLALISAREPTNSLVVIISDFGFELSPSTKDYMRRISSLRNSVLLSIVLEDRQEDDFPSSSLMANIYDSESGESLPIDLRSVNTEKSSLINELRSLNSYVALVDSNDKHFKRLAKFFSSLHLCK